MKRAYILVILILGLFLSFYFVEALNNNSPGFFKKEFKSLNSDSLKMKASNSLNSNLNKSEEKSIIIKLDKKNLDILENYSNLSILSKTSNGVVAQALSDTVLLLQQNKDIEVLTFPNYKIQLQNSTKIINASVSWNLSVNSANLNGTGQTVCILDTGINYSHPGLSGVYVGGYDYYNSDSDPKDDNGHGTHVAGIVHGIAPGAKIVSIKVCNSAGNDCPGSAIALGIDWCINNRVSYNISVISMSLGSDCTADPGSCSIGYCNSDSLASYVDNAVSKNISVVVASGNDGYYNVISSPACIQNATPVTSTNKADINISSFANTWNDSSLFIVAAPGESINSTYLSGYTDLSGTSMATPHVAGAIAIFNQYLNLSNQQKSPAEIENLLNSTGKQIYESYANRNFSRINIYDTLFSFGLVTMTLISPENNNFTNINFTNFNCSGQTYSNFALKNITFYLWNSTNSLIYNETQNIGGTFNSSFFNYTFTREDSYNWNCLIFNNVTNFSWASLNRTLTYDITAPRISLNSPVNDSSYTTANTLDFSYNITENFNISNCSLIANGLIVLSNSSIFNVSAIQSFSKSFSAGDYNWSINCSDRAGNQNFSEMRNFTVTQASNPPSGGGGGGGGGSSIPVIADSKLIVGYTSSLGSGSKISFNLQTSSSHSLKVNSISVNSVNLTLASNPLNVVMAVGEELKLNLTSKDYYDLYLRLNSISNGKANLTLQSIYEPIVLLEPVKPLENQTIQNTTKTSSNLSEEKDNNKNYIMLFTIILVVVIILVLIITNLIRKPKNKSFKKKK